MLCGTPVLGFPLGAMPEIVDEGVTGFLVTEGDASAMARVASALRGFDRAACARRARERFGADIMVSAYEAIYRAVIARHHGRAASDESGWRAA
jgi:glycosyltransferase involved in cell wall biosynthesis